MTNEDLTWLARERPAPTPLGRSSTARARGALLDHTAAQGPASFRPHDAHPHGRRSARRPVRYLATAAAAAVALVIGLTVAGGSHPEPVSAAPLAALSTKVEESPAPTGDATLVLRTQAPAGQSSRTGHDLYVDDGRYFYGDTADQLSEAVASGGEQDGGMARIQDAAIAALDVPLTQARTRMADAALDPNADPADPAAADPAIAEKEKGHAIKAMDPALHLEGMVWSNSLDALVFGAGRPEVRAGVLRLLAGSPHVTVVEGEDQGRPTLVLTARHFSDGYQEQLTIDAETGSPIGLVGGTTGQAPSVTITYEVSRVTVADLVHR